MAIRNLVPGAQQLVSMGALPWFGGIAVVCLLAGMGLGAVGGYKWNVARALKAENVLASFQRDQAETNAKALGQQAQLQAEATAMMLDAVRKGVDKLSGQLARDSDAAAIASMGKAITTLQQDIRYACRSLALPDDYLRGMHIPRAEAGPAADNGH